MSTALVVIAHPNPGSFTHAMAHTLAVALEASHDEVVVHDLYAEGFDPVLRDGEQATTGSVPASGDALVERHRADLARADTLVVAHPNWWGKPPAIMSGWIDRVVAPGVAYRLGDAAGVPETLLRLTKFVVLNTSDTPRDREISVFGDPLQAIWRHCVGSYLGDPDFRRFVAGPMATSTAMQRLQWLAQLTDLA